MSNKVDDQRKQLQALADEEERRRKVQQNKLALDEARTEAQLETLKRNQEDLKIAQTIDFSAMSPKAIEKLVQDNEDYMDAAKNSMTFMNEEFIGVIPYFRKNLILIGGKTGEGKSTTVANIAWSTMRQSNPATGKKRKVLVITNEEKSEDVYNRITCLGKGWAYTNHDKFTEEQKKTFSIAIKTLGGSGDLTVIDNDHEGAHGLTTSIEGICNIFDNLIAKEVWYDVVIIDYYQNIKHSKKDMTMDEFKVQAKLASMLDIYKNLYPAPIIVMAQVNPPDEKDKTPFQYRIKGRKTIVDVATCAVEMIADREHYRTQWTVHKSRFNECVGKGFWTGFLKGKYVPWNPEFATEINKMKEARMFGKTTVATKEDRDSGAKMKEKMGK